MPTSTKPARKRRPGETTTAVERRPAPRLPHERDESVERAPQAPHDSMRQAHEDLKRGLRDTDRGPVVDKVYRKLKK
jgi:hypothetical protein